MLRNVFNVALVLMAAACSSRPPNPMGDAGPSDAASTPDGPATNGTWTQVIPLDPMMMGVTPSGLWFDSTSNGVVSFVEGYVEHFSAPTMIDKVVLDGHGKAANGQDDAYYGFLPGTSLGLLVRDNDASQIVASADKGATFTYTKSYTAIAGAPQTVTPNWPLIWLGTDASNGWHLATLGGIGGDVWAAPTPPGPMATLTDTWHPGGDVTVPATIPSTDCSAWVQQGYYAGQPGWDFVGTSDGKAMIYSAASTPGAICRSTDGGKNFVDVSANISPSTFSSSYVPWVYLFSSATVGIGVYGSDLSGPGSAYVLYTTDGGANWTAGTLPASAGPGVALVGAFASPSGTMYIVGGTGVSGSMLSPLALLYKSTDGGKTWTDISAKLQAFEQIANNPPTHIDVGFALDDQHIWVAGQNGFIAYTSTGGQ